MKKIIIVFLMIILCQSMYSQTSHIKKSREVLMIENELVRMSSSWNELNLIKWDRMDTLFALPTECKEYKNFKFDELKNDSSKYYYSKYLEAWNKHKYKIADEYMSRYRKEVDKSIDSGSINIERLKRCFVVYTPKQIGWKIRCRIKSNDKYENIEARFDMGKTKIIEIISERYALMYDNMLHCSSGDKFIELKKQWDNRKEMF